MNSTPSCWRRLLSRWFDKALSQAETPPIMSHLRSPKDQDQNDDRRSHSRPATQRDIEELKELIMIAKATLDASLTNLTVAVDAAVAALAAGDTSTSTPDTVVSTYQAGVDAQTVRIATATPPPTPAGTAAK